MEGGAPVSIEDENTATGGGYFDYWRSVRVMGGEVWHQAMERHPDDLDAAKSAAFEAVAPYIEGSLWLVGAWRALCVLTHTRNRDAATDELGSEALRGCETVEDVAVRLAWWALLRDVSEEIEQRAQYFRGRKEGLHV